jgi:hypothetical protein
MQVKKNGICKKFLETLYENIVEVRVMYERSDYHFGFMRQIFNKARTIIFWVYFKSCKFNMVFCLYLSKISHFQQKGTEIIRKEVLQKRNTKNW